MTKLNSLIKVAMVATGIAACAADAQAKVPVFPDYDNIPQASIVYEPKLYGSGETAYYIPYTNYPDAKPGAGIRVTPSGWYHGNEKNTYPYSGPQDVFLGNQYIELGLHRNGAFGTKNAPPGNFHVWQDRTITLGLRASLTGWEDNSEYVLSNVYTGAYTRFPAGDPAGTVTRDFFTPSTIDEGWLVTCEDDKGAQTDCLLCQSGSFKDFNGQGLSNSTFTVKVYKQDSLPAEGETNHTIAAQTVVTTTNGLKVTQLVQLSKFDTGYDIWVTISNETDKVMKGMHYYRGFNPDQPDVFCSGSKYKTDNFYHTDDELHDVYVIASSTNTCLSSTTRISDFVKCTVTPFIFWAPDPKADPTVEHKYTIAPMTQKDKWTTCTDFETVGNGYHRFYDTGMSIRFDIGDVQPGEAVRIYFYSSLDPDTDRAIRKIQERGGKILLPKEPIVAKPATVANATSVVYTNGVLSAETSAGSGEWAAWSNRTATVVYTADPGYCFDGDLTVTVVTNELDTTKNPAVNANPPVAEYPPVTVTVPEVAGATAQLYAFKVNGGWKSVASDKVPSNATVRVVWTADEGKGLTGAGAVNAYQWQTTFGPVVGGEIAPAPEVCAAGASVVTVDLDTRAKKSYFRAEDILPIWYAAGAVVQAKGEDEQSWTTLVKSSATTNTLNWVPTAPDTYTLSQTAFENATIIFSLPVEVTTNDLEVAGATVAVTDDGGQPLVAETEGEFAGQLIVPSNSTVKVTWTATGAGVYFMDGSTTYVQTFTADKSVNPASEAVVKPEEPAAPSLKLGVVGQRYPWDGKLDVHYWAKNTPNDACQLKVTVTLPDGTSASQTVDALNGKNTMVFDAKEAFGEVKFTKGVKVKAELVDAPPPR